MAGVVALGLPAPLGLGTGVAWHWESFPKAQLSADSSCPWLSREGLGGCGNGGAGGAERPPPLSPGPRGKEPPSGTGCRKGDSRAEGGQVDGSHCRCFGTGSEVVVWLSAFPLQRLAFTRYVYGLLT